jgi:hypothetical protein
LSFERYWNEKFKVVISRVKGLLNVIKRDLIENSIGVKKDLPYNKKK